MNDRIQRHLNRILQNARLTPPVTDSTGVLQWNSRDPVLEQEVEFRQFEDKQYHRTKKEDFLRHLHILGETALAVVNTDLAKTEQIKQINAAYLERINALKININPDINIPENFKEVLKQAGEILWQYKLAVVKVLYPDDPAKPQSLKDKLKQFKKAGQEYLIQQGRPIIIHQLPDNSVSAQFPKGETTYPSDYRSSKEAGVNPNGVLHVYGERDADGMIEVKSVISRAVSYSVFGIENDTERKTLNRANAKQDVIDRFALEGRVFTPGQVVEITSVSLLTPLNILGETGGKIKGGYESETRQLTDHHDAVMALHNQTVTVNGVEIKLKVKHFDFNVKNPKSAEGLPVLVNDKLLAQINTKAFPAYVEEQKKSLGITETLNPKMAKATLQSLIDEAKKSKHAQKYHFLKAFQQYYSGAYKKTEHEAFLLAARIARSEELRGAFIFANCKSSRDRTEHFCGYENALVAFEKDFDEARFLRNLLNHQDYGSGKEANGKSATGFRANRVNDPSKQRKDNIDSKTSSLSKYSGDRIELKKQLKKIKNAYIRSALLYLNRTNPEFLHALNLDDIIPALNADFPVKGLSPAMLEEKYKQFLKILKQEGVEFSGVKSIVFMALLPQAIFRPMVVPGSLSAVKKLAKNSDELKEFKKHFSAAVLLLQKTELHKANELVRLNERLDRNGERILRFGKNGETEKPEKVYVFEHNQFVKTEKTEEDLDDAHVLYESAHQLSYQPPVDEETDFEILKQVLEMAMKKFGVTDIDELVFEGSDDLMAQVETYRERLKYPEAKLDKFALSQDKDELELKEAPTAAA